MTSAAPEPLWIACLCAAWCGVCRDYRATFDEAAASLPDARFVWVDVEDEAHLVDPVEVENFPTLLIASGGRPLFFGPVTPQKDTLLRLAKAHATTAATAGLRDAAVVALVARLLRSGAAR